MPWFVALALLVVPILEIYVIIQIGQVIGGWPTVGLLLVESALGAWIIKREGRRAWNALQSALQTGKMPGRELSDAALVLVGGTLLLTPGFVTDIFGFFFVLPFTRPIARRGLSAFLSRRLTTQLGSVNLTGFPPASGFDPGTRPTPPSDDVIQGEVIDPDQKK
ncbi:FxsA family protein [Kribbella sp. NPDC050820]|uniref:FxsA family protein n=1 Tax=Kribbella sp. NPDC050820 TaxID=3155408 RepID=UPI0033CF400E